MISRISAFALALFCFSMEVAAQSGATRAQNTLLPEINPQDIEIRSEFRARFPGLRRQPILGFSPKPSVFRTNPNRMPFMETREEAVASIAITQLDRPEPPIRAVIESPIRRNIYTRAGFGSYTSPEFSSYFYQGLNQKSAISGNVDFSSSNGHLNNQSSGFRFLDGDLRFVSKMNRQTSIQTTIGGVYDFNRLYNLAPIYQDEIGSTAQKSYGGLNAAVSITQINNSLEGFNGNLSFNYYNSELDAGSTNLGGKSNEQYVSAAVKKYWPGSRLYETFSLSGDFKIGNYDNPTKNTENVLLTTLRAGYKKLINFNLHVSANAGVAYVSDGVSSRVYVTPQALINYNLKDAVILKAGISGNPTFQTLQDHFQTNRFLSNELVLQHSYTSEAFSEVAFQLFEGNKLYGGLTYSITKNKAYYDRKIETQSGQDYRLFYALNYDKATELEFYGGITQQINPEEFWFDIRFYARRPTLESGGDIPFEERIGLNSSISYKAIDDLLLSGWIDVVGSRQAPASNEELEAYTLAGFQLDYEFSPQFGVYTKVLNILGQKYELWDGYQERPFQVFGGLILKF